MQKTCTRLQRDNHTNTSSLNFYRPDALPDAQPCQSTEGIQLSIVTGVKEVIALRRQDDMTPPPMAVRLAADLCLPTDGSTVYKWLCYRQPACLQAWAAAHLRLGQTDGRADRQTDELWYCLMPSPPMAGGIISTFGKVKKAETKMSQNHR